MSHVIHFLFILKNFQGWILILTLDTRFDQLDIDTLINNYQTDDHTHTKFVHTNPENMFDL